MASIGFAYAAAAAIANSCIDSSRKMATQRFTPMELVSLVGLLDAAVLSSIVFGSGKFSPFHAIFPTSLLRILVLSSSIKVLAGFLYQRALHISPLSMTIPYLAFTPVLLVFTSFFLMREMPSYQGLFGVVVVTVGGYLLSIDNNSVDDAEKKGKQSRPNSFSTFAGSILPKFRSKSWSEEGRKGGISKTDDDDDNNNDGNNDDAQRLISIGAADIQTGSPSPAIVVEKNIRWHCWEGISLSRVSEPFLALKREEGSLLMLGVAALLSIANSLDKMGAHLSPSSVIFAAVQKLVMAIPLVLFLLITSPGSFRHLFRQCRILLAISLFEVVAFICYLKSLETLLVSYAIAAKRANVLISVIIGRVLFKEKIWGRLPSILFMVGGMLLIVFA